jgi:hypothetical protein
MHALTHINKPNITPHASARIAITQVPINLIRAGRLLCNFNWRLFLAQQCRSTQPSGVCCFCGERKNSSKRLMQMPLARICSLTIYIYIYMIRSACDRELLLDQLESTSAGDAPLAPLGTTPNSLNRTRFWKNSRGRAQWDPRGDLRRTNFVANLQQKRFMPFRWDAFLWVLGAGANLDQTLNGSIIVLD